MVVFMDIEGAIDWVPFQKLVNDARGHGVEETLTKWRWLCAQVGVDRYLITKATKRCPQGGVPSPSHREICDDQNNACSDGSKTEQKSGAGVYFSNKNKKYAFQCGQYAKVFQPEVYAILRATAWMINERLKGRRNAVCIDSQMALSALIR